MQAAQLRPLVSQDAVYLLRHTLPRYGTVSLGAAVALYSCILVRHRLEDGKGQSRGGNPSESINYLRLFMHRGLVTRVDEGTFAPRLDRNTLHNPFTSNTVTNY